MDEETKKEINKLNKDIDTIFNIGSESEYIDAVYGMSL